MVELYDLEFLTSSGDGIPERDVTETYLLSVYSFTTELRITRSFPEHSSK